MENLFLPINKEYLEGYLSAKAGKTYHNNPYLSYKETKKFAKWKKGFEDFNNGIELIDIEMVELENN